MPGRPPLYPCFQRGPLLLSLDLKAHRTADSRLRVNGKGRHSAEFAVRTFYVCHFPRTQTQQNTFLSPLSCGQCQKIKKKCLKPLVKPCYENSHDSHGRVRCLFCSLSSLVQAGPSAWCVSSLGHCSKEKGLRVLETFYL